MKPMHELTSMTQNYPAYAAVININKCILPHTDMWSDIVTFKHSNTKGSKNNKHDGMILK
jgi:hypothetical protein